MKSTFETIGLFVHKPVRLVELLILYACVQFYTPLASDYRLISKTERLVKEWILMLLIKKTINLKTLYILISDVFFS
jgi:hypothetical protein